MRLIIDGFQAAETDILQRTMERCLWWAQNADTITILVAPRSTAEKKVMGNPPGWIEYGIQIQFDSGARLFVAAIQREPGCMMEFHS